MDIGRIPIGKTARLLACACSAAALLLFALLGLTRVGAAQGPSSGG